MKQNFSRMAMLIIAAGMSLANYAQSGVKYPYVQDGKIIVSRDSRGGVKSKYIGPGQTTKISTEDEPQNKVCAKLEVYATDNSTVKVTWDQAMTLCPSGWRLPSQRELMLVFLMRKQLTATGLDGSQNTYWTNTGSRYEAEFYLNMGTGRMDSLDEGNQYVRCVRDVN